MNALSLTFQHLRYERYGLVLTAFAAWRVKISYKVDVRWVKILKRLSSSKVEMKCHQNLIIL